MGVPWGYGELPWNLELLLAVHLLVACSYGGVLVSSVGVRLHLKGQTSLFLE